MATSDDFDPLLAEQIEYYRAAAREYGVDADAARQLAAALEAFGPTGRVLELACGPCFSRATGPCVRLPSLASRNVTAIGISKASHRLHKRPRNRSPDRGDSIVNRSGSIGHA